MTETTPRRTAAPEDTTQQLRVTPPPGPLDPAKRRQEPMPQTEVLSIDDLMGGPPDPVAAAPVAAAPVAAAPVAATPAAAPAAASPVPAAATVAAAPVAARPARPRSEVADRLRADAAAAWADARRQGLEWLNRGDNALIVATAALAVLLLLIVAAVG